MARRRGAAEVTVKARRTTTPVIKLNHRAWTTIKTKHKAYAKARQLPCWLAQFGMCLLDGVPIDYDAQHSTPAAYETDHRIPRSDRPDLTLVWANLEAAHCKCNRSRQSKPVEVQHVWVRPSW